MSPECLHDEQIASDQVTKHVNLNSREAVVAPSFLNLHMHTICVVAKTAAPCRTIPDEAQLSYPEEHPPGMNGSIT